MPAVRWELVSEEIYWACVDAVMLYFRICGGMTTEKVTANKIVFKFPF